MDSKIRKTIEKVRMKLNCLEVLVPASLLYNTSESSGTPELW